MFVLCVLLPLSSSPGVLEFAGHLGWTWVGSKPFHAAAGSSGLGADVFLVSNAHGDK